MRAEYLAPPDPVGAGHLLELADALRPLADRLAEDDGHAALDELVRIAVERVLQARWASLAVRRGNRVATEASTGEVARLADRLQDHLGAGPCGDPSYDDAVYVTGDVAVEPRWPEWGRMMRQELGIVSVLSQCLTLLDESGAVAALNIYSDVPDAFGGHALGMGLVLASHGSLLVTATLARGQAGHLVRALESNREIGVAMGILMQRHAIGRDEAFALLRTVSQDSNRKLAAVASDVADTGVLDVDRRALTARG